MKLVGSLTSPYVRKVRAVLAEKKIEYEFVIDVPWSADTRVPDINPLGKVPVLILDDGSTLFDSRVIAEYLDSVTPNNRLLPSPNRERITIKRWEALADGVVDAAVAIVLESKRPEAMRDAAWIARHQGKITAGLAALSADLGDHPWCYGNGLTLADIALCVALGYLAFRMPALEWREAHENLTRLYDKVMQRPSFAETIPHD
ncbi:MAG: glutathione S-transferase [Sterolibacteriaceae bacterium]|nr:glutathione S-transferase [Sterolibacteriaceae bacterium]MBK9085883.1 glutathione S-transferase [Sterolibacteriaceae bacterium]